MSLVPSATETLSEWGVTPVAVTRFCERPDLPHVGGTKDPDVAAVVALVPDLVVCCREENRREDAEALEAAGLPLFVFDVDTVEQVPGQLSALAARVGLDPATVPVGAAAPVVAAAVAVRAFVPIWRRPWMTLGDRCYGTSVLGHLGVSVVLGGDGDRYPTVTLEEAAEARPDLVLAPSEPYPFSVRHRRELEAVAPVVFVDGQDLFWWGVRTPGALTRLAAVIGAAVRPG